MSSRRGTRLRRGAVYGAALVLGVSVVGGSASWIATRRGFATHRPPGQLVDVGGHRLHIHCTGTGPVSVVLESALGGWSIDWAKLQPLIAQRTRVCAYDRAGYGWSDPSGRRYSPQATARELHELLQAANVPGPYLLVGHSAGGLYVRHFAALYPAEVAGLVLVDPSHENLLARLPADSDAVAQTQNLKYLRWIRFITITGVTRLLRIPVANSPDLEREERGVASAIGYRYANYETFYNEASAFVEATETNGSTIASPDVPVVVLTSSENAQKEKTGTVWRQLHEEIAEAYPQGSAQTVEAGHFIHVQRPDAVLDAVVAVLELR